MEYKVYQKIKGIWTIVATYYHDDPVLNLLVRNENFKIEKINNIDNELQLALF